MAGRKSGEEAQSYELQSVSKTWLLEGELHMAYLRRLLGESWHSTPSNLQLVQGTPMATRSQRTLRARHPLQA